MKGTCDYDLREKVEALKSYLETYNRKVFGKVDLNKMLALDNVPLWDETES